MIKAVAFSGAEDAGSAETILHIDIIHNNTRSAMI